MNASTKKAQIAAAARRAMINDIQKQIARVIVSVTGADVEVLVSSSIARGVFVSLFGMPADCDAARTAMDLIPAYRFNDRDIDPDEPKVVDFYHAV
jgi:uncharacterized protein YbcI